MPSILERLSAHREIEYSAALPVVKGRVTRLIGLTLEAVGLKVAVGDYCEVVGGDGSSVEAEVVGFAGDRIYLMPLDAIEGLVR